MTFSNQFETIGYLPGTGVPGPLNTSLFNPPSSSAGSLGGEVAGLELNVNFSHPGHTLGTAGNEFGDLTFYGFS
jgi:hypothetical protein